MFNKDSKSLNNAFTNLSETDSLYVKSILQRNEVAFNETGTTIKSVNITLGAGAAGPGEEYNVYEVKLNQPFIYVIYDQHNMPLYIGNVDNPNL